MREMVWPSASQNAKGVGWQHDRDGLDDRLLRMHPSDISLWKLQNSPAADCPWWQIGERMTERKGEESVALGSKDHSV